MAEQRPITYKSLGFTLGLGVSRSLPTPGTAANSLLDTLLSSVPSAKALLPKVAPELSKIKSLAGGISAPAANQGLPSARTQELGQAKAQPKQEAATAVSLDPQDPKENAQPTPKTQPAGTATDKQHTAGPSSTVDVVNLASSSDDDEGEGTAAAYVPEPKVIATTTADPPAEEAPAARPTPALAEYIPLPSKPEPAAAAPVAAAPGSADALAEEDEIRRLGSKPYWMSYVASIDSPLLRLHQELVELCELVQPTPEEAEARKQAVAVVTDVVRSIWPDARVEIFGSYATGLYVPTSDIDLVILDSGCSNIQNGLKALATMLGQRQIARSIQVIGKARVPIVKFETIDYGNLAFDVSFDVANGPQAAQLVTEMTASWPMMRPLILCLKLFLQQRELNEVYTGGIGSYALITLVAAFLQLHASRRPKGAAGDAGGEAAGERGRRASAASQQQQQQQQQQQPAQPLPGTAGAAAKSSLSGVVEPGLGALLVDFFRFYGRVVNLPEVGISCAGGGQFFRKVDKDTPPGPHPFKGWLNKDRSYLLAVEDPKDPDNDVCRNSFNIMKVKTAFEYAYQMLTAPSQRYESLLARILRLGPILASRPRPRVEHLRELGYYCEPPERKEQARRERREQRDERKRVEQGQQQGEQAAAEASKDRDKGKDKGKKRGREEERGDGSGGGESGGRRSKGAEGDKRRRRESTPGKRAGGGKGDNGRSQKRRRDEASPGADRDEPAPHDSKRSRKEGRRSSQGAPGNGGGRQRDGGSGHDRHQHQSHQSQQPRRPALMQVSTVPAPAPVQAPPQLPIAPIFHPGYAPPPAHNSHGHHHHHHSRHQDQSRHRNGGGGGGGSGRSHHHSHHSHQHGRRDDRGGGYGNGDRGQGQGQGRQRAPVMVPQQYAPPQQQLRGQHHNHNGQRSHVFFE